MSQIQLAEMPKWFRKVLATRISQAEREQAKLLQEITKATAALPDYCNQLYTKAEQDLETKRENRAQYKAAKALARLTALVADVSKSVTIPQETNSTTLRNLQRDLAKAASEENRLRTDYLRQIRPYYIIDMMTFGGNIDKIRRLSEELHNFLMGHGTVLRSLEEFKEKMITLEKLHASRDSTTTQRQSIEQQLDQARSNEASLRSTMDEIKQNKKMKEYITIHEHLRELRKTLLLTGFSRLGRPLRKLVSISQRGDYPITLEVRESINEYLAKPFSTFLRESEGYPRLKSVMTTLQEAVSSNKLTLKQREEKKVIERTQQIVAENSLANIHREARRLKAEYDQCLLDTETAALVKQMTDLRSKRRMNQSNGKSLTIQLERAMETERKANDQISSLTREIQEFCSKVSGESVIILPS